VLMACVDTFILLSLTLNKVVLRDCLLSLLEQSLLKFV